MLFLDSFACSKRVFVQCRHPSKAMMLSHNDLNFHHFMTYDVEHLYMCLLVICIIYFFKATFQDIFLKEMRTSVHKQSYGRKFMAASSTMAKTYF